ncbi:MAG TPA: hypothetical protein VEI57_11935 [Nitrospirota bacterium]|nr:hypothetical protein [Nitrospirota bacterium]
MELDISVDKDSISIGIDNPFHLNIDSLVGQIEQFIASKGQKLNGLDVRGLLPRMVKGIAGCEAGCPADAKSVVKKGYENFKLDYIEGGILSATAEMGDGKILSLKLFPDF